MQAMAVMPKNPGNAVHSSGTGNESAAPEDTGFSALLMAQIKGDQGVGAKPEVLLDVAVVEIPAVADALARQKGKSSLAEESLLVAEFMPVPAIAAQQSASPALAVMPSGKKIEGAKPDSDVLDQLDTELPGALPDSGRQAVPAASPLVAAMSSGKEIEVDRPDSDVLDQLDTGLRNALPGSGRQEGLAASPALAVMPSGKKVEGVKPDSNVLDQLDKGLRNTNATLPGRQAEFAVDGKILPQNQSEKSGERVSLPILSMEPQSMPESPANALSSMMVNNHSAVIETKAMTLSPASIQIPVGTTGWGDAFGQKVVWMAGQQTQVAELHLNPPHLGPMEVRISVSNDQISALFVSHQPAVREAIEAAMPRLREMFADSGMTLGNATVSSDSLPQQSQAGHEGHSGSSRQSDFSAIGDMHSLQNLGGIIPLRQDGSGMVDLFA